MYSIVGTIINVRKRGINYEGKIDTGAASGAAANSDGELRYHGGIEYPDNSMDRNNQFESTYDICFCAA